jgi:hypothetical protein
MLHTIAEALKDVGWVRQRTGVAFPKLPDGSPKLPDLCPMPNELRTLLSDPGRAAHVWGVVANINDLISDNFVFAPSNIEPVNDNTLDSSAKSALRTLRDFCLSPSDNFNQNNAIHDSAARRFAEDFLRVAALYHDIGKIVDSDRHVARGVHIMRDISDIYREGFEHSLLEGRFEDKHNFWTLLSHHDTFGGLCTGECSLPAFSQMESWAGDPRSIAPHRSPAAVLSYLLLLNIADADSSMWGPPLELGGLRTVEASRYFADWRDVKSLLWDDQHRPYGQPKVLPRQAFKEALLKVAARPKNVIERLTRIVTTSYRVKIKGNDFLLDETEVKKLVEDELEVLHGHRLEVFCNLFTRFCKIDYGRRFFDVIMQHVLLDAEHGLQESGAARDKYECPKEQEVRLRKGLELASPEFYAKRTWCLKEMTRRICSIMRRIVDDYGDLVSREPAVPLMCIVMANIMPRGNTKTAWAICSALKEHESRVLAWISEEVAVSPYSG